MVSSFPSAFDRYKVGSTPSKLQLPGARCPTSGLATRLKKAVKKLQAGETYNDPRIRFLKRYTYALRVNDLVRHGAGQYVVEFREAPCFEVFIHFPC
jgi:hypothetical protein